MDSVRVGIRPCAVCAKETRHRVGRLCAPCFSRLRVWLVSLPVLAGEAVNHTEIAGSRASLSRTPPGSRPPINLDAIDPALATIELAPGDSSSRVSILEAFESWERVVRAANDLVPYGVASSMNRHPLSTTATLGNVCRFLSVWLEWMAETDKVDIVDFSGHVKSARRVLVRWSWEHEPPTRWRVACPALVEDVECGAMLNFAGLDDDEVECRKCRARWSPARLLAVAASVDAEGIWIDAEAAGVAVGVDPSTVRRWARSGRVRRQGQRYSLADIKANVDTRRSRPA